MKEPQRRLMAMVSPPEDVPLSPQTADEVKFSTCYMCACRCGIRVHLKDGKIRYIDGNRAHPVNRGVLCGKGSAGIMQHYSPARLRKPLLRVGERGSGEFREIEWEEALTLATNWLSAVRARNPRELAFFTGRDQSQSFTGWWAAAFGTPNFAAHGGFCSVNMAAAGLYSVGGAFWEFGEPDWEHARYFLLFGVAEDHDSNPIKIGLSRLKERGVKIVTVNPVRTGYSAIADEWIGITPGTDGLFVGALIHELLDADRIDLEFLARYTNAAWLVVQHPGTADDGLFVRDDKGQPQVWDRIKGSMTEAQATGTNPAVVGTFELPDGRTVTPAFQLLAERYLRPEFSPEAVAERCGIETDTIRRIARELGAAAFDEPVVIEQPWTDTSGRRHARMLGRGVAMHAMRGISAHSNGFHTCRAIHVLQMLLGAVDTPGSWRYKSPFPRPIPPGAAPAGKTVAPNTPLSGNILGFPQCPEDLLVDEAGLPLRLDKAFSWEAPLALHGKMHMVISNAANGDPYPVDTLFMYMANMAWNSAMNPGDSARALTAKYDDGTYRIPHIIYADAYFSETVAYADLVLPDTTYLERFDCISLLDRPIGSAHGPADAIRQPVVTPDRDVKPFQDVLIELGTRLGLPGFVDGSGKRLYRDYADYIVRHERKPGIGPLAGWRGPDGQSIGRGPVNPEQLKRYIDNGCYWHYHLPAEQLYFKFANKAYLDGAKAMGLLESAEPIVLQLYSEPMQRFRLAAEGFGRTQPPDALRKRIRQFFDPLPLWYPPLEEGVVSESEFPFHGVTQRPMPMYHSWGSQNAWLRQILSENRLYMNRAKACAMGLEEGDWVWVESRQGRVKCRLALMEGCQPHTVWTWNAIGKRSGAWNLSPDAPESQRGFLLNHVLSEFLPEKDGSVRSNSDPVTGQAAWYDARVRIVKAESANRLPSTEPRPAPIARLSGLPEPPQILRYSVKVEGA